jgi:hypothetical protein
MKAGNATNAQKRIVRRLTAVSFISFNLFLPCSDVSIF